VLCGEHSAWIHLFAAAVAIALGLSLNIDLEAWRWIILCIGLVIFSEILNTAIEAVCDVVSPQYNAVIGLAKDMGAGAVLVCAITALVIGALTFAPYIGLQDSIPFIEICGAESG